MRSQGDLNYKIITGRCLLSWISIWMRLSFNPYSNKTSLMADPTVRQGTGKSHPAGLCKFTVLISEYSLLLRLLDLAQQ